MTESTNLPDETIRRLMDYTSAVAFLTNGRYDFKLAPIIADEWATRGYCVLKTSDVERRFGTSRRTAFKTIQRLIDAGAIREIGRTDEGHRVVEPCLELGDEWRRDFDERAHD